MNEHHDSIWIAIAKAIGWFAAWFTTVKIADVQVMVSILSGLLVGALAAANFYVTWRDKIRRRK